MSAVAVTYEGNIPALEGTYEWTEGTSLMVVVRKELNADAVAQRVLETLGISGVTEIERVVGVDRTKLVFR